MKDIDMLVRKLIDHDPANGFLYWSDLSSPRKRGNRIGSGCTNGYISVAIGGKRIHAHRICFFLFYGYWPSGVIDHVNHNTLDNSIRNLRHCSILENIHNSRKAAGTSSKYKGVNFRSDTKKWEARIRVGGKRILLGHFKSEDDAGEAYRSASRIHHGQFSFCEGLDDGNV